MFLKQALLVVCRSDNENLLNVTKLENTRLAGSQVQSCLRYDFLGGNLSEIWGRIPRGIAGILGLIPPGMCFSRWDAIRNLRQDPNFNWRDPMWDPMQDVP